MELFKAMPYTVKVTGSESCARSLELAECSLLSVVEDDDGCTTDLNSGGGEEEVRGGEPVGSRSQGVKRSFAFVFKKQ